MEITTLDQFYQHASLASQVAVDALLPEGLNREIGHFNIFNVEELYGRLREKPFMPYNRRTYYKISLIIGRNRAEYADKVINVEKSALLFGTPKIPYHWIPLDWEQKGFFCI